MLSSTRPIQHGIASSCICTFDKNKEYIGWKTANAASSKAAAHFSPNQNICLWYTVLLRGLKKPTQLPQEKHKYTVLLLHTRQLQFITIT